MSSIWTFQLINRTFLKSSIASLGISMAIASILNFPVTITGWAIAVVAVFGVYSIALVAQRLWFHPLSKIPGPWYARVSYWYEFYQDIILGGEYVKNYPEIHAKYGK